jgi:hypothetical protein
MLQAWQSYCNVNKTTHVPKSEFKLNGWVRDIRKAYKHSMNKKPSTMNMQLEKLLKAVNFPFIHPTTTNILSD